MNVCLIWSTNHKLQLIANLKKHLSNYIEHNIDFEQKPNNLPVIINVHFASGESTLAEHFFALPAFWQSVTIGFLSFDGHVHFAFILLVGHTFRELNMQKLAKFVCKQLRNAHK